MNFIKWMVCLFLRANIAVLSWFHERVKNGPPARLWLARDSEILFEAKKRGLLKKKAAEDAKPVSDRDEMDAIKIVTNLQRVPERTAVLAVARAKLERPNCNTQDLISLALKYAA